MDEKEIVKKIEKLRKSRKMSLGQLATLTGLTKGYLSKIERSNKLPPFSTLVKMANAFNIDVSLLISEDPEVHEDNRYCIVRKNERKEVVSRGTLYGYTYETLAHKKLGKNFEPFIVTVAPEEKGVFSHEGEEFFYVLEGVVDFSYDNRRFILKEGDSLYIDSAISHTGRSIGGKRAKMLTIMYSYKRQ